MEKSIWRQLDDPPIYAAFRGEGPLIAAAIHDGHYVRPEVAALLAIDEATRLREEDPYTGLLTLVAPSHLVGLRSRFEIDLNRPRDKAVYLTPEDAWGLDTWRHPPPRVLVERSLAAYDSFYADVHELLESHVARYDGFIVLDIHSYNHRRSGPESPAADAAGNPDINVGTGSVDRARWGRLVDRFMEGLRSWTCPSGARLDVRENVKFLGGNFPTWINHALPGKGLAIAVEFKKTFMDEWSGVCDYPALEDRRRALDLGAEAALRQFQGAR